LRSFDSKVDLNRTAVTLLGNGDAGYHVILLDAPRALRMPCLQSAAMDKTHFQNARRYLVLTTRY